MGHYLNGSCRCLCVVLVATLLSTFSLAQGTLAGNRDLMRRIADGTANVIAKNFYDQYTLLTQLGHIQPLAAAA